jgi:hypothetical protein
MNLDVIKSNPVLLAQLDRAIELKDSIAKLVEEINAMPIPRLGVNSVEDVDDLYQERLEYNWWLDEKQDELALLNNEKNKINVELNKY